MSFVNMKSILSLLGVFVLLFFSMAVWSNTPLPNIYPAHLQIGDTVALISSASYSPKEQSIVFAKERLEQLGLHVIVGKNVSKKYGYFAGTAQQRAADINRMFANPKVKAIFEVRGGWGSAELLNYIDYSLIKKNPKIIIGFSDITSLLLAIHQKTGLVTFHGPLAVEPWPAFTVNYLKKTLFSNKLVTYQNPTDELDPSHDIIQTNDVIQTVVPGVASGELVGGNLSVLVTLLGTPYEPLWDHKILFVEDVGENNYQIDRMLSQLKNAGVFSKINGFVFGQCTSCEISSNSLGSFSLYELIKKYALPNHLPTFMGSMISHQPKIFTLPEGDVASINATTGVIKLKHAAVS